MTLTLLVADHHPVDIEHHITQCKSSLNVVTAQNHIELSGLLEKNRNIDAVLCGETVRWLKPPKSWRYTMGVVQGRKFGLAVNPKSEQGERLEQEIFLHLKDQQQAAQSGAARSENSKAESTSRLVYCDADEKRAGLYQQLEEKYFDEVIRLEDLSDLGMDTQHLKTATQIIVNITADNICLNHHLQRAATQNPTARILIIAKAEIMDELAELQGEYPQIEKLVTPFAASSFKNYLRA